MYLCLLVNKSQNISFLMVGGRKQIKGLYEFIWYGFVWVYHKLAQEVSSFLFSFEGGLSSANILEVSFVMLPSPHYGVLVYVC